jgi:hypothetical protein
MGGPIQPVKLGAERCAWPAATINQLLSAMLPVRDHRRTTAGGSKKAQQESGRGVLTVRVDPIEFGAVRWGGDSIFAVVSAPRVLLCRQRPASGASTAHVFQTNQTTVPRRSV